MIDHHGNSTRASTPVLARPPIIEAVLDLDCDLPLTWNIATVEAASRETYRDRYPRFRTQLLQGFQIEQQAGAEPRLSTQRGIQALQFLTEDERQLVQVRAQGFSFNRLAPYTSLDEYLPEIERIWQLYVELASPVHVRSTQLRYINRILLPLETDRVELNDYIKIGPRLPDEEKLILGSFLNQYVAVEVDTGNQVTMIMTNQAQEQNFLPIILDIAASRAEVTEPENWDHMLSQIQSLRGLKNRVFQDTLTERCLDLFR